MLRITTVNVNGIRAALRKGMADWSQSADTDLLALQEVRAANDIVHSALDGFGYEVASADAEAKGRAGVAVLSRTAPTAVRIGNGDASFDASGRWIEADFRLADDSTLTLVSAYVHSGEAGTPKQEDKYRFLEAMAARMPELASAADHALIVGDLNVGHTELDIKNWKANRKKAGFLPEERAHLDRFVGELGWVDVHRSLAGEVPGPYTWWSMRGRAFDNDAGWRIDYQLATPALAAAAVSARVDRAESWDARWSDHAPLVVDYDIPGLA